MQLFYNPEVSVHDIQVIFPREESKHIAKVLRKKEGDILHVTNGKGQLFTVEITSAGNNQCAAKILKTEQEEAPDYHLHMVVAPTKMNDRYEWFLEKATEIGVHEITPVICDHSERKVVKEQRFERILQSAMKQSLHYSLPKLNEAISLKDFLKLDIQGSKYIAHCEEDKERFSLKNCVKSAENCLILIGPEGDFSPEEIKLAIAHNWKPVSLGNSRLRTETAAIVACHTVALVNQD